MPLRIKKGKGDVFDDEILDMIKNKKVQESNICMYV